MTDYLIPSNVLDPFTLWTDMGLRALDLTLSSSQNLSEGVDRFTRAGADPDATEHAAFRFEVPAHDSGPASGVFLATRVQRSVLDLMAQGWIQWMGMLGSLVSLAAGSRLASVTRRNLPADLTSGDFMTGDGAVAHTRAQPESSSHARGRRTEAHAKREPIEHALASSESKRRRGASTRSRAKTRSRRA